MTVDQATLDELMGRFTADFAAAMHAATVVLGDKLGLYRTLAEIGPVHAADLAAATRCDPRLVQEWLDAQYVSGYCARDAATGRYHLTPEQIAVLADPGTPAFLIGAMSIASSAIKDEDKRVEAFRSGRGLGWHEHHHDLFHGTERLFRPGYVANLVDEWIPALDGVAERLRAGALVADLGCGHGASTLLLAQAYPNSTVIGFDSHADSIDTARKRAAEAGLVDRVRFEVASAQDFPGSDYDSSASSTPCMTWVPRSPPPDTCARHSPRTRPCCSSNRWRAPTSRGMSTSWDASSTRPPLSSARRTRSHKAGATRWVPKCRTRPGPGLWPPEG
jgi:hypothetical protein